MLMDKISVELKANALPLANGREVLLHKWLDTPVIGLAE